MSTLSQQLKQLSAASQQHTGVGTNRVPSFLYTQDQASGLTSEEVWEVGYNGFLELCQSSEDTFEPFKPLFASSSKEHVRSMQSKGANKRLNVQLTSFLRNLSPYFVLPAAHKALEWLVRHYQVHHHNVQALIECALPYHTTKVFVRLMQLLDFPTNDNKWKLFEAVKKTGAPLDRALLAQWARGNHQLLRFICSLPAEILADDNAPSIISPVLKLFVSVLTGVLEEPPTENLLTLLLPYLLVGIQSPRTEFRTATYMVLMNLWSGTTLSESVTSALSLALCENAKLNIQASLPCLASMYLVQNQASFDRESLDLLTRVSDFVGTLADLSVSHSINPFMDLLVCTLGNSLDDLSDLPEYVTDIANTVQLTDNQTVVLASSILRQYLRVQSSKVSKSDKKTHEAQVQDVVADLERRNPLVIDSTVREWTNVNSKASDKEKKIVHQFVSLALQSQRLQVVEGTDDALFLSLKHPEDSVREIAMDQLLSILTSDKEFGELDLKFFREALLEALADSSEVVASKALQDLNLLKKFVGKEALCSQLATVLSGNEMPLILVKNATAALLSVCSPIDAFKIFFPQILLCTITRKKCRAVVLALAKALSEDDDRFPLFQGFSSIVKHSDWKAAKKSNTPDVLAAANHLLLDQLSSNLKELYEQTSEHEIFAAILKAANGRFENRHRITAMALLSHCLRYSSTNSGATFAGACAKSLVDVCLKGIEKSPKGSIQCLPSALSSKNGGISKELCLAVQRLLDATNNPDISAKKVEGKEFVVAFQHTCRVLKSLSPPAAASMLNDWSIQEEPITAPTYTYIAILMGILRLPHGAAQEYALKLFFEHIAPSPLRLMTAISALPDCPSGGQYAALQFIHASLRASTTESSVNFGKTASETPYLLPYVLSALCSDSVEVRGAAVQVLTAIQAVLSGSAPTPKKKKGNNKHSHESIVNSLSLAGMSPRNTSLLVTFLLKQKMELESDSEQIKLLLSDMVNHGKKHTFAKDTVNTLVSATLHFFEQGCPDLSNRLLQPLVLVKTPDMLKSLHEPLTQLLSKANGDTVNLSEKENQVLMTLMTGFSGKKVSKLYTSEDNEYFQTALKALNTKSTREGRASDDAMDVDVVGQRGNTEESPRSYFLRKGITKSMFESLPDSCRIRLFTELCKGLETTTFSATHDLLHEVFGRMSLSSDLFSSVLSAQLDAVQTEEEQATPAKRRKGKRAAPVANENQESKVEQLTKCGVFLEVLQFKDLSGIPDASDLVPVLFDLLNLCVGVERALQPLLEYTKQLLLSNLNKLCKYLRDRKVDGMKEEYFNVEQIVQCIRVSDDPQSHNSALLLLSTVAAMYPARVLRSIMPIFTFMGATTVRQDNNLSFHVIEQTIQTIIPALLESEDKNSLGVFKSVVAIAGVFVDALGHIPAHRRLQLFDHLARTLGAQEYLHTIQLLILKALVISETSDSTTKQQAQELCHSLSATVSAGVQIEGLVHLTSILTKLLQIDASGDNETKDDEVAILFNPSTYTNKQFRQFVARIVTFISTRLSSSSLRRDVTFGSSGKGNAAADMAFVQDQFSSLLTANLKCISTARNGSQESQLCSRVLPQLYDVLSKINRLLPDKEFVAVVGALLSTEGDGAIQRRCLSLLEERLQSFSFTPTDKDTSMLFLPLVDNVLELIGAKQHEDIIFDQMSLYTLSIFVSVFGKRQPDKFLEVLQTVTKTVAHYQEACQDVEYGEEEHVAVLTTGFVCVGKLCANLKLKAIAALPALMPPILTCAKGIFVGDVITQATISADKDDGANQNKRMKPSVDGKTVRAALQRATLSLLLTLVNSLPTLVGPYLSSILTHSCAKCVIKSGPEVNEDVETTLSQYVNKVVTKAAELRTAIGKIIPARTLLPALAEAYFTSYGSFDIANIPSLSLLQEILLTCVRTIVKTDIGSNYHSIFKFLLQAFAHHETYFKSQKQSKKKGSRKSKKVKQDAEDIANEEHNVSQWISVNQKTIDVLVALIFRLSEANFRPLFIKLIDWSGSGCRAARLSIVAQAAMKLSQALKSLFVPFFGLLLGDFIAILEEPDEQLKESAALIPSTSTTVITALYHCFLHDDSAFVTKDRLSTLLQPLVNQLTVQSFDKDTAMYTSRVSDAVIPAIRQLAVNVGKEPLWRQINNAVLLKTQHSDPEVRLSSMKVVEQFYEHIGDEFLCLLPETVPYIAELMEDDSPVVERQCQHLIKKIEEFLGGESLTKFL